MTDSISKQSHLDLDSPYGASAEYWERWAYKLGLQLDNYIPLLDRTNAERIEEAIKHYVELRENKIQKVLAWLDFWGDKLPDTAVSRLQDILGVSK